MSSKPSRTTPGFAADLSLSVTSRGAVDRELMVHPVLVALDVGGDTGVGEDGDGMTVGSGHVELLMSPLRTFYHFFDTVYYPCLEAKPRMPYGLYVHGNNDVTGAVRAVESIAAAMSWRPVRPPVTVTGPIAKADLEACWELGALLAAEIGELA
jgi:hypothetical protein